MMGPCETARVTDYDVNMVRAFALVYETRSVSLTAKQMHLSQPSISYSLSKLRRHFGDPLFQKRGGRMVPTALADSIYPEISEVLRRLEVVLAKPNAFDPVTTTRTFTISTTDVGMLGLAPRLMRAISSAPGVTLRFEPLHLSSVIDDLTAGRTDAVICTPELRSDLLTRDVLFRQVYLGICAPTHPRIGDRPTIEEYLAERHVVMTPGSGHTVVMDRQQELGLEVQVAITVPNFTALPGIVSETELLGFAPQITARRLAEQGTARTFELPFDVSPTEVSLYMLRRATSAPPGEWLRRIVIEELQTIDAE